MVNEMSRVVEVLVCAILVWLVVCRGSESENTVAGSKFIGFAGSRLYHDSRKIITRDTVGEAEFRVSKVGWVDSGKLDLNEDLRWEWLVGFIDCANVRPALSVGENCAGGCLHC